MQAELGDNFEVKTATEKNSGISNGTAVVVTRKAEGTMRYRNPGDGTPGSASRTGAEGEATAEAKRKQAEGMSAALHTPVTLLETEEDVKNSRLYQEADDETREKMLRNPGWFDNQTGEVVVNLSQNKDAGDVAATMLHESVGHKGLRRLFGKGFDAMLDHILLHCSQQARSQITALASRNGWNLRLAPTRPTLRY